MVLMPAVVVLLMAGFGILLNVYVVRRLHKFARKEPGRFDNGCGLPLLVMTIADILALFGVVVFGVFGSVIIEELHKHSYLQNVVCKVCFLAYISNISSLYAGYVAVDGLLDARYDECEHVVLGTDVSDALHGHLPSTPSAAHLGPA